MIIRSNLMMTCVIGPIIAVYFTIDFFARPTLTTSISWPLKVKPRNLRRLLELENPEADLDNN